MTVRELRNMLNRYDGSELVCLSTSARIRDKYKVNRVEDDAVYVEEHRTRGGKYERKMSALVLVGEETTDE